ncbi:MAG: shikimate dehydrogenase [Dysgonamonadaceae bacterium]|jgi:shikimate dehydrogenase|nr:shikimate dehydrogenase [Dysgonamonadaceae bacterium]MDD3901253.1 shikimate dehydrogenase [Dysgonamonadaceae bacterium]MEA5082138.1 shikimate dehydrogenase [Dysgonamonadaceae bacterium]
MDTYGLIGFPLTHSFSTKYFAEKFIRENIDAEYLNFEIEDILEIRHVLLFNQHLKGLNVTIPYKEKVIPFLNNISDEAKAIGAVNVIKVDRKHNDMYYYNLTGYNTDYIGFKESIYPLVNFQRQKKALILGTGGASKAVNQVLKDLNIETLFVSRTPRDGVITYKELTEEILNEHLIIVNASPIGTFPKSDTCPDIPYTLLTPNHLLFDLVYNPAETLFLKKGKEKGATVKNGAEMLHLQAEAAWRIWNT